MAKRLEQFKFRNGRPQRYPWDEWLNGTIWQLEMGEDFNTAISSFRAQLSKAAAAEGKRARTSQIGKTTLIIQGMPLGGEE